MFNATLNETKTQLVLTINGDERDELSELLEYNPNQVEAFMGDLLHEKWDFISPENIGALTDSPILSNDVDYLDNGDIQVNGLVAWYPNYQIECPFTILAKTGKVTFTIA
jgi:hypothetical protein